MCPDIETFAPLISAGFGLAPTGPGGPGDRPSGPPAPGQARRPRPDQHQPAARRRRHPARAQRWPGHRLRRARPGRRPRPAARRFWFTDDELDRVSRWVAEAGVRWGIDARGPVGVRDGEVRAQHLAGRLDRILLGVAHERRRPPPPRPRAAARRRRQQRDRPRRPARRAARPASDAASPGCATRPRVEQWTDRAARRRTRPDRRTHRRRLAGAAVRARAGPRRRVVRPARGRAPAARRPGDAPVAAGRPPDPRQLPHRHPHRLHDGADALGARTAWSAWSASTTASSRAPPRRRRRRARPAAAHRRARRPQRGPPAPARRAARRDRARRDHLHRRQRALRRPPPARRTPRRDPRRRRPHHRRAGARADPAPATRSSPTTPATSRRRPGRPREWRDGERRRPFSFDTAALAGARAAWGPRHEPPPLLPGPLPGAAARGRLARRPQGVPRAPGAGVPARPARRVDAVRARRAGRRDPGQPQRARGVAGRRPPAARGAGRAATRSR